MEPKQPTWAQRFRDAVWEAGADDLTPTEALVLLAYADHARGNDTAWVAQSRLIQRCKLKSKGTPSRVLAALVDKGWLVLLAPAQWRNKQSPTYRMVIQTAPIDGALYDGKPPRQSGRSKRQPPRSETKPPRSVDQTAPSDGANRPVNRTPLSSERPSGLSGGEATRPASPRDAPPDPEQQDPPTAPVPGQGRAAALAIAREAKRRDVVTSHWRTPPDATPNPQYNPTRAARSIADLPVYERTSAANDEGDR